jgi:hypothetical protein
MLGTGMRVPPPGVNRVSYDALAVRGPPGVGRLCSG